jgi:transcriptional regulator with XRE-family HTH domain
MSHIQEELATQAKRILDDRGWSLRQARRQTGISHTTIADMLSGVRVSPETITRWATAIGEDPAQWLQWAGYERIVRFVFPSDSPHLEGLTRHDQAAPAHQDNPIEEMIDAEERRAARARAVWNALPGALKDWHRYTPEQQDRIRRAIDEALKEPEETRKEV